MKIRRMCRHGNLMLLGPIFFAALLAASPAWANEIRVSQSEDRSQAMPLDGSVIFGEVFIFFFNTTPESQIQDVEFYIDGMQVTKDKKAPYDLAGGDTASAKPFDTRRELTDGPNHSMEVIVNLAIGSPLTFGAIFGVDNAFAPIEPSTSLQVVTATADTAVGTLTLEGFNFDRGLNPQVALDLHPLQITFSSGQTLEATLPAGVLAGDHLVNLSTDGTLVPGLNDRDHAELLVTISATDLSCVGCVSAPEVNFAYAGSATPGGRAFDANRADFARDADLLDGLDSSLFSLVGHTHSSFWQQNGNDVFYNGGNVGIGTTNPVAPLQVSGPIVFPGGSSVGIFRADSPETLFGRDFGQLEITNADQTPNNFSYMSFSDNTTPGFSSAAIATKYVDHARNYGDLFFWTRGASGFAERLYITSDGDVGIATTQPDSKLYVKSAVSERALTLFNDTASRWDFEVQPFNYHIIMTDFPGLNFNIGKRAFGAAPGSFITRLMTITNDGNVGVGTPNPSEKLHVVGNIFATGSLNALGGVASSRSLKENISPLVLGDAFSVLARLDPVMFTYKADPSADLQLGFIAEEVPDLVATSNRKGIGPMDLIAVLTKVVQEQQKRIEEMEEKLMALEDQTVPVQPEWESRRSAVV